MCVGGLRVIHHHHADILAGGLTNDFIFPLENQLAHATGQMNRFAGNLHRLLDHRRTTKKRQETVPPLPAP
jgi:hypothetical protein